MRPFRTEEMEMAWLTHDQISQLLGECKRHDHPDLETVVRICLATGARWSEAESLRKSQLAKYKITYTNTKGRKNRTVPISKELYESLPDDKKVGCLVIVMARSGLLWKEQASNYRQDNLPTFCATPSPATL
jgi:integrase